MLRRIFALTRKEFIHLRRDWWLPVFMLLGGALELLLVGWATSRPVTNLPFMVWDQDRSAASRQLVVAMENTGTLRTPQHVEGMGPIEDALNKGKINAALVIPADYTEELNSATGSPSVLVVLNGAESTPALAALRAVDGVAQTLNQDILVQRLGMSEEELSGFEPSLRVWFNENLSEAFYTTPAELGLMLEFTVLLFAALTLHNLPEGLAVGTSFSAQPRLGLLLALAIALHNVPEGIAVAGPFLACGMPRKRCLLWTIGSGMAEPIAAFAGATIAKANMWKTAFSAFKFAKFLYLGPFLFGYVPGFSLNGSSTDIAIAFALILFGTYAYSWLLSGIWMQYFKKAPAK